MTSNRLIALARFNLWLDRFRLGRWIIRTIILILLILAVINSGDNTSNLFFGLVFIVLPVDIIFDLFQLFLHQEVRIEENAQLTHPTSESTTYSLAQIWAKSGTKSLRFWFNLLRDPGVRFVLSRLGLEPKRIHDAMSQPPDSDTWTKSAQLLAKSANKPLSPEHYFEAVQSSEPFVSIWNELGITSIERQEVWAWWYRVDAEVRSYHRDITQRLRLSGGIGRDWSSGYTKALEEYATNITNELQKIGQEISLVGHSEERKKVLEYLGRDYRHNVILVGDEGIGKQRLIYALASDFNQGKVPARLKYKHVYMLDVGKIISSPSQNELETRLQAIFNEAATVGNVVVVIPDFQLLVGGQGNDALGVINASAVISAYLQSPSVQIIASIVPEAYYTYVKPNQALDQFLLPVEVSEIKSSDALKILEDEVFRFEAHSKHIFTYQALTKIIEIADRHIHDKPFPEKALGLLDEASGGVINEPQSLVFARDIERIISKKLKVPIGNVTGQEREALNNLESMIKTKIIGQVEAVKVVANALRRARAGLNSGKRPIGTFLFLGPTGVGKTEMAKTIAAIYYQNQKAFIRLDMSEYQTPETIDKLIGTRNTPGLLTTSITDQPFSVVLLDEIEKASPNIRNLFLQILDDGHITDGFGHKADFTNAMVIATSNAGSQMIREAVNSNQINATFKQTLLDWLQAQGIFAPEWLNRFDATVVFLPLTRLEIVEVAKLQVGELIERLKTHNINLTVSEDVYELLIERGYDPEFGARPMRRAVQDSIETALAKTLLNDSSEGQKNITLTREMLV